MPPNNTGSTRSRQLSRQERIADRLDIDPNDVAVRDTLDRGTQASLTSEGATAAERQARREFASEADFVTRQDVTADADRQALSVSARIAEGRRDDVAERAAADVAQRRQFVSEADLDADVGRRGVQSVSIEEERRDDVEQRAEQSFAADADKISASDVDADLGDRGVSDVAVENKAAVAQRVRQDLASDSEFISTEDVDVEVSDSGVERAAIPESAQKSAAAERFDQQLEAVDVTRQDITQTDSGFAASGDVLKKNAAQSFGDGKTADQEDLAAFIAANSDTNLADEFATALTSDTFQVDEVLKDEPGVPQSAAFLDRARDLTSAVSNNETIDPDRFEGVEPAFDPSTEDFVVADSDDGRTVQLREDAQAEQAAVQYNKQFDSVDVGVGDVESTIDGFEPSESVLRRSAAAETTIPEVATQSDVREFLAEQAPDSGVSDSADVIVDPEVSAEAAFASAGVEDDQLLSQARELGRAVRRDRRINPAAFEGVERDFNLSPGDFTVEETGSGRDLNLTTAARERISAGRLDRQFGSVDIGVGDVEQSGDGFALESDIRRSVAAEQFETQTPLEEVDPSADLTQSGDGFALAGDAQREIAADRFEEQTPIGQVDPQTDVTATGDGFALAGDAQREFAAQQFEQQTALEDVNPNTGLTRAESGFGLSTIGQRQLAAERFEAQTGLEEVDPQQDILLNDDGSATLAGRTENRLAAELLDEQVDADVGVDDVDRVTNPDGSTEFEFDPELNL
jgi:hypothetical protein